MSKIIRISIGNNIVLLKTYYKPLSTIEKFIINRNKNINNIGSKNNTINNTIESKNIDIDINSK